MRKLPLLMTSAALALTLTSALQTTGQATEDGQEPRQLRLELARTTHELTHLKTEADARAARDAQRIQQLETRLARLLGPVTVTVTAYSDSKAECGREHGRAASMNKPRPGTVAVSRDLYNQGFTMGRKVKIEGVGIYVVNDLMDRDLKRRVDVFMDKKSAKKFGAKATLVALME